MPRASKKVDLSKLSDEALQRELRRRQAAKVPKKPKETLKRERKAQKKRSKVQTKKHQRAVVPRYREKKAQGEELKFRQQKVRHRELRKRRGEDLEKTLKRLRNARKTSKVNQKYPRRSQLIKLTLFSRIQQYRGGDKLGKPYVEPSDDFFRITHSSQKEFLKKLEQAKSLLLDRVITIMESGAVVQEVWFRRQGNVSMTMLKQGYKNIKNVKMLGASEVAYDDIPFHRSKKPIHYKYIPADLNVPMKGYDCVDSYLMELYGDEINVELEKLEKLKKCGLRGKGKVIKKLSQELLDEIMGKSKKGGRSVQDIQKFCDYFKISHYALDVRHKLFHKEVYEHSSYKALIYYCVSNHLYPVLDKWTRDSITKRNACRGQKSTAGTNLKASQTDKEAEQAHQKVVERFKLPYFENVNMNHVINNPAYENCNIFYHVGCLRKYLLELYGITGDAYETRTTGTKVTCIIIPERNLHLYANMNHRTPFDWKDVQKECEKADIPFTNQSLTKFGELLQTKFNPKSKKSALRVMFSAAKRRQLWEEQNQRCKNCRAKVGLGMFQIDHITPLSQGGDNRWSNLQALCHECHDFKTRKETAERCFDIAGDQSTFNNDTKKIFGMRKNGFIHCYDLDGQWIERNKNGETFLHGSDINKCRTNICWTSKYAWCVFHSLDNVVVFDEQKHAEIPAGFYRVVTDNFLPFKGVGWYSYPLIRYGLKKKLISLDDITHCVFPTHTLPANHFVKFIEYLRANLANPDLAKWIFNMHVGSMGHKVSKGRRVYLTRSHNEAAYHKFNSPEDDDQQVHVIQNKEFPELMEIIYNWVRYTENSRVPIFNQVLDMEAIELHKIAERLKKHGGELLYLNTDNCVAEFKSKKDITAYEKEASQIFWDEAKTVPRYKPQNKVHYTGRFEKNERGQNLQFHAGETTRSTRFEFQEVKYRQLYKDEGEMDMKKLIKELVNDGASFQIQGRAGTGKTYLTKQFIKEVKKRDQSVLALCPTHKSCRALDADAQTLHSRWAVIKHTGSDPFNHYDWVIIDEKSMVLSHFWAQLNAIKRRYPKCKFVVAGDWDQLMPVCDYSPNFDYENSKAIWEICSGRMVTLTHCRRVDKAGQRLFEMCKDVGNIDLSEFPDAECPVSIAYNNRVRIDVNKRWMLQHREGKKYVTVKGIKGREKETQEMYIYDSMPMIGIENCSKYEVTNAEMYKVRSVTQKKLVLDVILEDGSADPKKEVVIPINECARLVQPAYCISVHRSQCSTIRTHFTIYQTAKMQKMIADGDDTGRRLLYVALSRAADISYINISDAYD